jgi:cytoskeletal protein CcmA (bactofilin family)
LFGGRSKEEKPEHGLPSRGAGGLGALRIEESQTTRPSDPGWADGSIVTGGIMANIGKSISIKGDLRGNEDLAIDGKVEGTIELPSHQLTVGADGDVCAEVHAKSVVIVGRLTGNVNATERVEIQATGSVDGDVRGPRLTIEEGAMLNGSVETEPKPSAPASLPLAAAGGEKSAASGS